jgi:hypothetical protein
MKEPVPLEDAALPALASGRHEALAAALARVGPRGARTVALLKHHRAGRLAAQWLRAAATPGVTLGDPYNPRHAPGRDIDYALAAGGHALSGA